MFRLLDLGIYIYVCGYNVLKCKTSGCICLLNFFVGYVVRRVES